MAQKNSTDYYKTIKLYTPSNEKQQITFSFNNDERTILGRYEQRDDLIFLYEYRGNYIGNEFFISFSQESVSYKLIRVDEIQHNS
jgi:hypothetical protein